MASDQCFCEQLCPVLCGELERFWLLAAPFAEREAEFCTLTFSYRTNTTDVSIRPLKKQKPTKHINTQVKKIVLPKVL